MRFFYDIETIPSEAWQARVAEEAKAVEVTHPAVVQERKVSELKEGGAAWKREKAILEETDWEAKLAERVAGAQNDFIQSKLEKAALHWTTGQIVSIAAIDPSGNRHVWNGKPEPELLNWFAYELSNWGEDYKLIGKNADNFDRPFLIGRFMVHNLGVPDRLRFPDKTIEDVQHIWGRYNRNKSGSLGMMAWALGLDPEDGSWEQVREWHENGNWDELGKYNLRDAELCQEIFVRYDKKWTAN